MARHSRRSHHHRYTFSGITDAYFLTTPLPASYGNAVSESRRAASPSDGSQDSLPHQSIIFPNNFLLETPSFVFEFEDSSSLLYDTRVYDEKKKRNYNRDKIVRIWNFWKRNLNWLEWLHMNRCSRISIVGKDVFVKKKKFID